MVRDGEPVARAAFTTTRSVGRTTLGDLIHPGRAIEAFTEGATLVFQSLHTYWPALGRFCAGLAAELGHVTQANAYLSPGAARGLAVHYDTHDVFALQVDGTKHWEVFAPVFPDPLAFQHWADVRSPDDPPTPAPAPDEPPVLDVTMAPGDCLYLPRGFVHRAWTTSETSLHITIGVHARTWFHAVKDLARLAADDPSLRATLRGGVDEKPEALRTLVHEWLDRQAEPALAETLRLDVGRQLAESAGYHAGRLVEATRTVDDATRVRPRNAGLLALSSDGREVVLRSPDHEVRLPVRVRPAIEVLLGQPSTVVADLAPLLDEAGRLVLVRRLLADGILTIQ